MEEERALLVSGGDVKARLHSLPEKFLLWKEEGKK